MSQDSVVTSTHLAVRLGYLGLLPFIFGLFLMLSGWGESIGLKLFHAYSVIILSFLGGCLFAYRLLLEDQQTPVNNRWLLASMAPSLVGLLSFYLHPAWGLLLLALAYTLLAIADVRCLSDWPKWYPPLRVRLTSLVVACHLWMIALSVFPHSG